MLQKKSFLLSTCAPGCTHHSPKVNKCRVAFLYKGWARANTGQTYGTRCSLSLSLVCRSTSESWRRAGSLAKPVEESMTQSTGLAPHLGPGMAPLPQAGLHCVSVWKKVPSQSTETSVRRSLFSDSNRAPHVTGHPFLTVMATQSGTAVSRLT